MERIVQCGQWNSGSRFPGWSSAATGSRRRNSPHQIQSVNSVSSKNVDEIHEVQIGNAGSRSSAKQSVLGQVLSYGPLRTVEMLFLPRGWPDSVTSDYLNYQLWTFPSHVTGWMSTSLAGSSMLKALGLGGDAADSVGFSAAIKWVTKDGIGAAGRLFVGGKLGFMFDEDPKKWRMIAEGFTTLGLALEMATQVYPSSFILLAGGGTVARAMGTGIGRPCFRVIQTHFALENNIGDVSAKEEVWEVAAQLIGIAASVATLSALEQLGTPEYVVPVWAAVHSLHVAFRYYSLKLLCFPWPNFKRGSFLASTYIRTGQVVSVEEAAAIEPMFQSPNTLPFGTHCVFGSSWSDSIGSDTQEDTDTLDTRTGTGNVSSRGHTEHSSIRYLVDLYSEEKYILTIRGNTIHVLLWLDACPRDEMRALWQACWLDANRQECRNDTESMLLHASLQSMQAAFEDFESQATIEGWDFLRTVVPSKDTRLSKTNQT